MKTYKFKILNVLYVNKSVVKCYNGRLQVKAPN